MAKIRLYGYLGEKFGRYHEFEVRSPGEAIRALIANYPEFGKELSGEFHVMVGYESRRLNHLNGPMSDCEVIRVIPSVSGAGVTEAIAAILYEVIGNYAIAYAVAAIVVNVAVSLIISGITSALTKSSKGSAADSERPENRPSEMFNGVVNTTAQGHPVPVGYGRLRVGSQVASVGLSVEQVPV